MIKVSDLHAKVIEIAKKNPDTIYEERVKEIHEVYSGGTCRYVINSTPACLVGVALSELGMSNQDLAKCDHVGSIRIVVHEFKDSIFEIDDYSLLGELAGIQRQQDDGMSWGDAVKE